MYKSERKRDSLASIPEKQHTNNPLLHNNPLPLNPSVTQLRHVLSSVESGCWSTPGIFFFKSERFVMGRTHSVLSLGHLASTQHNTIPVMFLWWVTVLVSWFLCYCPVLAYHTETKLHESCTSTKEWWQQKSEGYLWRICRAKRPNTEGNVKEIPEQN